MEASKITIGEKTYDLNHLSGAKKTNLRRKRVIEYIQSKPAGEYIKTHEFQRECHFTSYANTWSFIKRMMRDGVIQQFEGEKPKSYYYAVTGATRQVKPADKPANLHPEVVEGAKHVADINAFVADMQKLGVEFTITITNKKGA